MLGRNYRSLFPITGFHRHVATLRVLAAISTALVATAAQAHVGITNPNVAAGSSQIIHFGVGHGCAGADTTRIVVTIPAEVTSVRGIPGTGFGEADVITDEAGLPLAVAWEKDTVRDLDDAYYQLSLRISVPATPFATLYFPVTQTCRDAEGVETVVEWNALPGDPPPQGEEEASPAAALSIVPARSPGWNRYVAQSAIIDLSVFKDAEIVWVGDAAYSSNQLTAELIANEEGVAQLVGIEPGAEIWVKY